MISRPLVIAIVLTGLVLLRLPRILELLRSPGPTTSAWDGPIPALVALFLPLLAIGWWIYRRTRPPGTTVGDRRSVIGIFVLSIIVGLGVLAPVVSSYPPMTIGEDVVDLQGAPPSWAHPFGTDRFDRDVMTRVLYGTRSSLVVAGLAVIMAMTIGTMVGMTAGLGGRVVDQILMRTVDTGLAVPRIFLVMVIVAFWGNVGQSALIAVLGLTGWFGTSRIVRAEVLSLRARDFVAATHAAGLSPWRTAFGHILPNAAGPVLVNAVLGLGSIVLIEAGISFLGLGLGFDSPSLGNMIRDGMRDQGLVAAPWLSAIPGAFVFLLVLAFSLIGDSLRDRLDPRTT